MSRLEPPGVYYLEGCSPAFTTSMLLRSAKSQLILSTRPAGRLFGGGRYDPGSPEQI